MGAHHLKIDGDVPLPIKINNSKTGTKNGVCKNKKALKFFLETEGT